MFLVLSVRASCSCAQAAWDAREMVQEAVARGALAVSRLAYDPEDCMAAPSFPVRVLLACMERLRFCSYFSVYLPVKYPGNQRPTTRRLSMLQEKLGTGRGNGR